MGIVESVGPEVTKFQVGDRVVACFDIGCGSCMCVPSGPVLSVCVGWLVLLVL